MSDNSNAPEQPEKAIEDKTKKQEQQGDAAAAEAHGPAATTDLQDRRTAKKAWEDQNRRPGRFSRDEIYTPTSELREFVKSAEAANSKASRGASGDVQRPNSAESVPQTAQTAPRDGSEEHKWKDANGNQSAVVIDHQKHLVHTGNMDFSRSKITRTDSDLTTEFNKDTGEIRAQGHDGTFYQKTGADGFRAIRVAGNSTIVEHHKDYVQLTIEESRETVRIDHDGLHTDASPVGMNFHILPKGVDPEKWVQEHHPKSGLYGGTDGRLAGLLEDGTLLRTSTQGGLSLKKADTEVEFSADGKHTRMRLGNGSWQAVTESQIPNGFRERISKEFVRLDNGEFYDLMGGRLITKDAVQGTQVHWERGKDGDFVLHLDKGMAVAFRNGLFVEYDTHHPERKPITIDPETLTATTGLATMYRDRTVFGNGNEIQLDGSARFKNADGTYDKLDNHFNYSGANGVKVASDLRIETLDGFRSDACAPAGGSERADGSPEVTANAAASQAVTLAASIVGKATLDSNDIQLLVAEAGDIAGLISSSVARGDMASVAMLMAAQGSLSSALSHVRSQAQVSEIAKQKGAQPS